MDVFRAADASACTPGEAERLVRSFLSAGVDTTIDGICNMLLAFARFLAQWQRLHDDPPVEVEGTVIPEGEKVLLFYAAASRDPRRGADADGFDIGRHASGHVASATASAGAWARWSPGWKSSRC